MLLCPGCKSGWEQDYIFDRKIPEVNIISAKASVASVNEAGGPGGAPCPSAGDLGRHSSLRKFLGSKEHLDWLKIDLKV